MKTKFLYYCILFVYLSLWICQLIACHLTHSLVILTDSYINLYRIFDISLGIIHLSTQQNLAKIRGAGPSSPSTLPLTGCGSAKGMQSGPNANMNTLAYKIFQSACTYQYKRLPLLGSFVNGMFLAALLMSAAIEGVQTCFHVKHSENHNKKTILTENVATYPFILVGFALVSLIMQYCSLKAHEMREEELCSESFLNLSNKENHHHGGGSCIRMSNANGPCGPNNIHKAVINMKELNVSDLAKQHKQRSSGTRRSYDLNLEGTPPASNRPSISGSSYSLQDIPLAVRTNEIPDNEETRISLKSLRFPVNVDDSSAFDSMRMEDIEAPSPLGNQNKTTGSKIKVKTKKADSNKTTSSLHRDSWFLVRCLASPVAMLTCAIIFYLVDVELMTEISDAALAVSVVVLLFAASYPPMKKAGRILLQTVPDGVNLEKLKRELENCSGGDIVEVRNLHVWSLTPRSNRVATCQLVLDQNRVTSESQVQQIVREAKFKFLDQHIKCTTIEPVLVLSESQKQQSDIVEN